MGLGIKASGNFRAACYGFLGLSETIAVEDQRVNKGLYGSSMARFYVYAAGVGAQRIKG
jgi:hypothetical protein